MEDDVPVSAAGAVTSAPTSPPPATPSAPRRSGGSGRKSASGGASRLRKSVSLLPEFEGCGKRVISNECGLLGDVCVFVCACVCVRFCVSFGGGVG